MTLKSVRSLSLCKAKQSATASSSIDNTVSLVYLALQVIFLVSHIVYWFCLHSKHWRSAPFFSILHRLLPIVRWFGFCVAIDSLLWLIFHCNRTITILAHFDSFFSISFRFLLFYRKSKSWDEMSIECKLNRLCRSEAIQANRKWAERRFVDRTFLSSMIIYSMRWLNAPNREKERK